MPLLASCQTQEQTGGALGGLGGAGLGALAGGAIGRSPAAALIGAGIGGLGGYFIGSSIGRRLDEADAQRAARATQQVLAAPAYYPPPPAPGQPPPPPRPPRPVRWASDHNSGVAGSAKVVAVQPLANGGECRLVREIAVIQGQEQTQNTRYCRSPDGHWTAQA